jgi:hypothetical protein
MHRLVIALTTLLTLVGGTVVGGYLLFFSASVDRAAAVVPAETPIYVNVYLRPSTAQQMNLGGLLGHLPGFGDQATLDSKIDEVVQQLLAGSGVDYRRDIKPWLGDQLAVGVTPTGTNPDDVRTLLVAEVKDRALADQALSRLVGQEGAAPNQETYHEVAMVVGATEAHAFLDEGRLLVIGNDADEVRAAIDARSGAAPALGSEFAFRTAMSRLPADHLASAYLDLDRLAAAGGLTGQLSGYSNASIALVAEQDGLHVVGQAPFDETNAGASARAGFALSTEPSSLSNWMPADTQAEAVVFGLRQLFEDAESQIGQQPGADQVAQVIAQLRAVVAFGLGLNVDQDLLPLLDRETALAITSLAADAPRGDLLLRPSDAAAAQASLDRIRDALQQRGAQVSSSEHEGASITTLDVPNVASFSYAMSDGVVIIGLSADDVASALTAHASGASLGASAGYQKTFATAGGRGGNELYLDLPRLLDALQATAGLPADTRDILQHVTGLGVTVPAREDRIEFHAVVTIE